MNKLALSILAVRLPVPRLHRRAPAGVHAAVELRVQPGRARPRLRVLDHRDRRRRRLPDLRLPGHHPLRRDHPAELRHDEPGACIGRGSPSLQTPHDLDDLELDDDGSFSVVLSAERPDGPHRRLVGAGPARPAGCSCGKCSCDWTNEVDARVAIDRLDDAGADMTPEEIARRFSDLAGVDRGDDRLRHGPGPLLPRAPRREHVPALHARSTRWAACPSRPTTTASTRSTTTRR